MFVSPFVCSNIAEFCDERNLLREQIFPFLKEHLQAANILLSPVQVDYNESESFFKSGHLLRLLLTKIHMSQPFFFAFVGFKYGLSKKQSQTINLASQQLQQLPHPPIPNENNSFTHSTTGGRSLSSLEKNALIASQTGFSHVVNSSSFRNSFLEHQINLACSSGYDTSLYRIYFRQYEYLEEKFSHLAMGEERKEAIRSMEAEDEWAKAKLDEMKMRLIKQGITIRYYKSLDQLNQLILTDFDDTIRGKAKFPI